MTDLEELVLIKSCLAARDEDRTPEQVEAWQNFFQFHEPLVRNLVKNCASCPEDAEDFSRRSGSPCSSNYRSWSTIRNEVRSALG